MSNNSKTVPVDKSSTNVIGYFNDVLDKTLDFIRNNYIYNLNNDSTVIYTKYTNNNLIRKLIKEIIPKTKIILYYKINTKF